MRENRNVMMGVVVVALLGWVSLQIAPPDLGCGGTEFADTRPTECPVAKFDMTMEELDLPPVERKMCLRTLKVESACTVYEYNLVVLDEEPPDPPERASEHLQIVHGRGCETTHVEGKVIATVEGERVEIAMTGTPTRAPVPATDTMEPLATGNCTSADWQQGEFELNVQPAPGEEP